ncbi:hypothetical protein HMPREF1508_1595 [Shuttleworthella sp. MSX8B]|uniref:DUF5716 family protein n=1 Tax=Shuttleworthella sp. MSX8B TaxID=936574 RepID=UPI0004483B09|nr:DUF5716 family protein [Shuttleworthia sp. MSX8B]EUB17247.1 hypothetical protein HMPREF1508_1595 [Shuttleworthia sp. MSX8B]
MRDNRIYYGIDLDDSYTMFSYLDSMHKEPQTMSPVLGSGLYQIPTCIGRRRGEESWLYGEDAVRAARLLEADLADQLFSRALAEEEVYLEGKPYHPFDLLLHFLNHLMALAPQLAGQMALGQMVFVLDRVDAKRVRLIGRLADAMHYSRELIRVIDRKESFYYFVFHQQAQIFVGDVALFSYQDNVMRFWRLHRDQKTQPQMVTIEEKNLSVDTENLDLCFDQIIDQNFKGDRISSVYLIGSGFEGDWMKLSLNRLCRGRRVFIGKNLYTKGACYCGRVRMSDEAWPFAYLSSNDLKVNVGLQVLNHGKKEFRTLLAAGENRYEAKGTCEVILDKQAELELWIQEPRQKKAYLHVIELSDLPRRPPRTSRLRVQAKSRGGEEIEVKVFDLGFGDFYPSSGQVWTYQIALYKEGGER